MSGNIIELPRRLWSVENIQFAPRPSSLSSTSALSGIRSVYGPTVHFWRASFTMPEMEEEHWREVEAIIFALGGIAGRLRMGNPMKVAPYRNLTVAPTIESFSDGMFFSDGSGFASGLLPATAYVAEAADAEADSFVVGGLPESISPALYMADLLEIRPDGIAAQHGHLYAVTRNAPTDAAGLTRVEITPPLRQGIAVGDQVVLDHPTTVFRVIDDDQGVMSFRPGRVGQTGLTLLEDIEI